MKKCVDVRELADGVLVRLFVVSSQMAQDQWPNEDTDWRRIEAITRRAIQERGLSPEQVVGMVQSDAENLAGMLLAFRWEQDRERRQCVQ